MAERGTPPAVTVVVPVFRNRETLAALRERIHLALAGAGLTYDLLFVDDACPQGSLEVLRDLAAQHPEVRVLALTRNGGQNAALLAGLGEARGDRVVLLDADLQDPPEALPALLEKVEAGASVAFGGRWGPYESRGRLLTSRLYKGLQRLVSGVPSDAGLFLAMDRRMVAHLLRERPPFLVPAMGLSRLPLVSLPVKRSTRPSGRSSYSGFRRLATGCRALLWVLRRRFGGPASSPVPPVETR